MIIRKAELNEYQEIRAFYHSLIDRVADFEFGPGWIKDVYPAPKYLEETIGDGELYVGTEDGKIISSMAMNHKFNEGYRTFDWPTKAEDSEITVIHILGVHPDFLGRGYAKQMVHFVMDSARKTGQKVLRLDVLKGNVPAEKLYEGMGFQHLHTLPMYYEDTGWTDYELYEYRL